MRRHVLSAVSALALLCASAPAYAFYNVNDKAEAYSIGTNESAFWIPDVGDNKNGQAKFDSEDYYNAGKIAAKRFIVPHHKLSNSGGTAWFSGPDSYVPDGRLIIVDRAPYSREWVSAKERGTGGGDESFHCQSAEGLNITVGMSVGASISEANAAKYLYRYGTQPITAIQDGKRYLADRTDPVTIFTSVYYGRELEDVMDRVVRKRIQTLVCSEISARKFDDDNKQASAILDAVTKKTVEFLASDGITLDFLGYADTFEFDESVQKAVDDAYISNSLKDALPVLEALAQIKVEEGLGTGLATKGPPVVITPGFVQGILDFVKGVVPGEVKSDVKK